MFYLLVCCLYIQNHKARDKAARFRICQLINRLLQNLGEDAAIDDSLYEEVYSAMQIRLRDKFPVVRMHAVLALARLQDPSDPNCPIVAGQFCMHCPSVFCIRVQLLLKLPGLG